MSFLKKPSTKSIRILAIPVAQRTSTRPAYLVARTDYLDNSIDHRDTDDLIDRACELLVPENGQSGFAEGALFVERDALNGVAAVYENVGTTLAGDSKQTGGSGSVTRLLSPWVLTLKLTA